MSKINFADGAHYYDCKGDSVKPEYEATLREARKGFFYVSPTTLEKQCFVNEFLNKWKTEQVALAAAWNPIQPHEDEEGYMNRIYQISLDKSLTAANFGKEIHDSIEHYPQLPLDAKLIPYVDLYSKWHEKNVKFTVANELMLADHDLGVAGRSDKFYLDNQDRLCCVDYKTQGVKKDDKGRSKPVFYDSWARQLAFYAVAYAKQNNTFPAIAECTSLIIDSTTAQEPFVKVWTAQEIKHAYLQFILATWAWMSRKNFWPAKHGQWDISVTIPLPA